MDKERETLQAALVQAHELARVLALNAGLDEISKTRSELAARTLLSILYTRLGEIEKPDAGLPAHIMSDY